MYLGALKGLSCHKGTYLDERRHQRLSSSPKGRPRNRPMWISLGAAPVAIRLLKRAVLRFKRI